MFIDKFSALYNIYFPLKRFKCREHKSSQNPWFNAEIKEMCIKKNKLYANWLKYPSVENKNLYKTFSRLEKTKIRFSKKQYYAQKLNENINNSKNTWKILNSLVSNKQKKQEFPDVFKGANDGETFIDHTVIANNFNKYFINVGPNLASKIPNIPGKHFTDYFSNVNQNSLFFLPTDEMEIANIVKSMKAGKAAGDDGISPDVFKIAIYEILKPLVCIINESLLSGEVPSRLKVAKVIPVFKKGDNTVFSNYRPISLLNIISKILEKIVAKRLISFLTKYKVLSHQQFGFREKHSTELALAYLIDQLSKKLEDKNYTVGVFLDLSKAFDTVNHNILVKKMELYGIRGVSLAWFRSYLSNRHQYVSYQQCKSNQLPMVCGVPQGSILGPLLFIIYINDLVKVSSFLDYLLFADDTNAFSAHKSIQNLTSMTNCELSKLSIWLAVNKLSVNTDKTNFMVIKPYQRPIQSDVRIELGGCPLNCVNNTKFLGVQLNNSLSWGDHIASIRGKVARGVGILARVQFILPQKSLQMLYGTLILPYLNYCLLNWGNASQCHINTLIVLQKKAIRIITHSPPLHHTDGLFKKTKILPLPLLYKLKLGTFMFKFVNKMLPPIFNNLLQNVSDLHSHGTRSEHDFYVGCCRLMCSTGSIRYQAPLFWNSLPVNLKTKKSISSFQSNLKKYLILQI